ncbi:hypothetical protein [Streptomyces sp. NPDC102264]|uniref:hypothetical protein n=1 Tax=Streptomyces sp. NPDC102264 TaxID=3366149 RepID=UPI0038029DD8
MSAWAELVSRATSAEELERLSSALEEVQWETSRRNAERIRRHINETWANEFTCGQAAADLIDPEVS